MSMTCNKPLTERLLSLYLKDLLTVDLFSIYLLLHVDIVIHYIDVDFMFANWASGLCSLCRRIHNIKVCYIEGLFHTFYCNFGQDTVSFVISRTSLNRGLLNRGSTVGCFASVEAHFKIHLRNCLSTLLSSFHSRIAEN